MFAPQRHGAPPKPKKKMPRIIPRVMPPSEMGEPEEQSPQITMPPAMGLSRLKNMRAMLTRNNR